MGYTQATPIQSETIMIHLAITPSLDTTGGRGQLGTRLRVYYTPVAKLHPPTNRK